ncbi:MAG: YibE/F family protein [Actinomycetes bacterium]
MAHDHGPGDEAAAASAWTRWLLVAAVVPLVVATVAGLVLLWPSGQVSPSDILGVAADRERGTVTEVGRKPCIGSEGDPAAATCPSASVELTSGEGAGRTVEALVPEGEGAPTIRAGDRVILTYTASAPPGQQWQVADFQRGSPLVLLAVAFAVLVVLFGRWRGVAALAGLAVSAGVLLTFVLPAILAGESPLLVAIVGSSAVMLVVLFLAHGFTARTAVAVLGTTFSLVLIGVLAYAVVAVSHFSGLGTEETSFLRSAYGDLDLRGLLLAGIIIGSLGVLDDVTVTQTSVVWEVAHANRELTARQVYVAGTRVGRDHVASTVNTLALAYAGASLPLLLLFTVAQASTIDVITTELVAQEVVRTLVGGIGIVAAVPLTTVLATAVAVADRARPASGGRRRAAV